MCTDIIMPMTCRCGSIKGAIVNGEITCDRCGMKRTSLSEATEKVLAGVAEHFGEPTSIVLRNPGALAAITKQDEYLKHKRTPDGETWFDIITDNMHPVSEGAAFTTDPEDEIELLGIAPDPIDAGQGNDDFTGAEKDVPDERE
jgi:hypothetical protein